MLIIDGLQYSNWDREIFEQMREGGVNAVHATVVYHEDAMETLAVLGKWNRLFELHGDLIAPVSSTQDILNAKEAGKIAIYFGFQNCSPIEDNIDLIEIFRQLNVFIMQLSYNNQSLMAAGCYESSDPGISRFGKQAIAEMNRVGMIVDMSHSAEQSTLEAIEISQKPIVISHANPNFFHKALRNKSTHVIKTLAESGGLLGFSLYPFHLKDGPKCQLNDFCQMVADTADLIGIDSIGIGSDLCQKQPLSILEWMRNGTWSKEMDYGEGSKTNAAWPEPITWFKDNRDFHHIIKGLKDQGFHQQEIEKVMGLNWFNFLEKSI